MRVFLFLTCLAVTGPAFVYAEEAPVVGTLRLEDIQRARAHLLRPGQREVIYDAACCKTCRKGKACGDSCISREKQCTTPPGCACDS